MNYLKKPMVVTETATDPVTFREAHIKFASFMCQTDPEIKEPRTVGEPIIDATPVEDQATPNDVL